MISVSVNIDDTVAEILRKERKLVIDKKHRLNLLNYNGHVIMRMGKALYVRINGKDLGKVHDDIIIGKIIEDNIVFVEDYNTAYDKVIEISDKPFKIDRVDKLKKSKPKTKTSMTYVERLNF